MMTEEKYEDYTEEEFKLEGVSIGGRGTTREESDELVVKELNRIVAPLYGDEIEFVNLPDDYKFKVVGDEHYINLMIEEGDRIIPTTIDLLKQLENVIKEEIE